MTYDGKYYFALDGSYGDATKIFIVDTSSWTKQDWTYVEEGDDIGRIQRAQEVYVKNAVVLSFDDNERYWKDKQEEEYDQEETD